MKAARGASSDANCAGNPAMRARCSAPRSACSRSSTRSCRRCTKAPNSAREGADRSFRAGLGGEGRAPDLGSRLLVEIVEELGEADDQVGLADQEVDRQPLAQALLELAHAPSNGLRVLFAAGRVEATEHVGAEGHDHAIERLARHARCAASSRKRSQPALSEAASLSCVV
jgi:hypothetical protein